MKKILFVMCTFGLCVGDTFGSETTTLLPVLAGSTPQKMTLQLIGRDQRENTAHTSVASNAALDICQSKGLKGVTLGDVAFPVEDQNTLRARRIKRFEQNGIEKKDSTQIYQQNPSTENQDTLRARRIKRFEQNGIEKKGSSQIYQQNLSTGDQNALRAPQIEIFGQKRKENDIEIYQQEGIPRAVDWVDAGASAIEGIFHLSRATLGTTTLVGSALVKCGFVALSWAPWIIPWGPFSSFHSVFFKVALDNRVFKFVGNKLAKAIIPSFIVESLKATGKVAFLVGDNIPFAKGKLSITAGWLGSVFLNYYFRPVINDIIGLSGYGVRFGGRQILGGLRGLVNLGRYHRYNI